MEVTESQKSFLEREEKSMFLPPKNLIFYILLLLVFLVGTTMGGESFSNLDRGSYYEWIFISSYIVLLKPGKAQIEWFLHHKLVILLTVFLVIIALLYFFYFSYKEAAYIVVILYTLVFHYDRIIYYITNYNKELIILLLWVASVTMSYVINEDQNIGYQLLRDQRYEQTVLHMLFFLILFDYFSNNKQAILPVLVMVALSTLFVAFGSIIYYLYIFPPSSAPMAWFHNPPFGAHMRHVGYQITASLAILLPLLAYTYSRPNRLLVVFILTVAMWSFLIWSGGRSAMASIVMTIALLAFIFRMIKFPVTKFFMLVIGGGIVGFFVSELLSVFPWNGLAQAFWRTTEVDSVNQMTSGRIGIWMHALRALKGHVFFGLGPQGYYFIPGIHSGVIQPHSMFIQFLIEWGVVGTVIFLLALVYAFYSGIRLCFKIADRNTLLIRLSAGSIIVSLTLHGLLDGTYYHPRPSFYLAIGFAIWLAHLKSPIGDP